LFVQLTNKFTHWHWPNIWVEKPIGEIKNIKNIFDV
jgi:hypothetical protein